MAKRVLVACAAAPLALIACSDDHKTDDLPSDPPTSVTKVASSGFQSPTDAVASPDGKTLYFAAWTDEREPALFSVPTDGSAEASKLATNDPLEAPFGLVLSCDGATLFVADAGGEDGAILQMATAGGAVTALSASGIVRPAGLAMGPDCSTLYATGRTTDGMPGLFTIPIGGGSASVVRQGDPLVSPTGLHVDSDGVAWVMDHLAQGKDGEGVLFAIPSDGSKADVVGSGLAMGTPGGVSLTAGGGTAVIPTRDEDGKGQLTSIDIATGTISQLAAPDITDPAGLRTARKAGVFAVVDSEGGAIFKAE
jgi:DNA-binding beta-propeller fold protein YncE